MTDGLKATLLLRRATLPTIANSVFWLPQSTIATAVCQT